MPADDVRVLAARGPDGLVSKVRAPALILQGTVDTLFPLDEAAANYAELARERVPVKMVWFCGGHGVCLTDPGDTSVIERDTLAWHQLGLNETKVSVALVIQLMNVSSRRDRPVPEEQTAAYLAPDSTDRTTCIAVVSAGRWWTRILTGDPHGRVPFDALVQTLKAGLGSCAFYAAYGTPGKSVRGWLVTRGWDLGLTLDVGPRGQHYSSVIEMADP